MNRASKEQRPPLKSFLIELGLYAALVVLYFLLVLHFLGEGIKRVYDRDQRLYAVLALALMIGQGIGLEMLTTWLLRFIRAKAE
jgi:hypothetical protein